MKRDRQLLVDFLCESIAGPSIYRGSAGYQSDVEGFTVYDVFGSYNLAWIVSLVGSLGGMMAIFAMESTKQVLIPDWEKSLPQEAQPPAPAV